MAKRKVNQSPLDETNAAPETVPVTDEVTVADAVAPEPVPPAEPKSVVDGQDGLKIASY